MESSSLGKAPGFRTVKFLDRPSLRLVPRSGFSRVLLGWSSNDCEPDAARFRPWARWCLEGCSTGWRRRLLRLLGRVLSALALLSLSGDDSLGSALWCLDVFSIGRRRRLLRLLGRVLSASSLLSLYVGGAPESDDEAVD